MSGAGSMVVATAASASHRVCAARRPAGELSLIAQVVAAGMRDRVGEIGVPTRYFEEASSVGFKRSVVYGLSTLRVVLRYLLHRTSLRPSHKLRARRPGG